MPDLVYCFKPNKERVGHFYFVCYVFCICITIGIKKMHKKRPVVFYFLKHERTPVEPPDP